MFTLKQLRLHGTPALHLFSDTMREYGPVFRTVAELDECPPFRKCESVKWQRRRNKQFYRVMDRLIDEGARRHAGE